MTVVPLPLHVLYHLLPGLYQPRYFPRRLGFFDSSQSLVFGIKEYITDLPHLLVYNRIFESREDFWFALGLILIDNNLPCEVRSVGIELPSFTGEVVPYFYNCDEFAKYYSAFDTLTVRPENIVQVEREYYRQKKLRWCWPTSTVIPSTISCRRRFRRFYGRVGFQFLLIANGRSSAL